MQIKNRFRYLLLAITLIIFINKIYSQDNYKQIPLPENINGVNQEYSGMSIWKNRLYLLPQYGSNKETKLDGDFFIYSLSCDSISRVIDRKDVTLANYRTIRVNNLNRLPDSVKKYYEGFEAITITGGKIFLSIETIDSYDSCFLLKGVLDTTKNEINIDPLTCVAINRFPYVHNAGFEGLTYLSKENKLLVTYEYNGVPSGGTGYLIDTAFKKAFEKVNVPFLYFRLTDITASPDNKLYGINFFWNSDYDYYLNNNILRHEEKKIKTLIPDLRDKLNKNSTYLRQKTSCYSRIISLTNYKSNKWKQVTTFNCDNNNWEGLALFKKGALVISDANRNNFQATTLAYISF